MGDEGERKSNDTRPQCKNEGGGRGKETKRGEKRRGEEKVWGR